jgi:hypothetical protein
LAHVALVALVLISVQPEPVTEQPMPTSELEVQAYQLERTQAREQPLENQQVKESAPDGTALNAGAIPQSRATPVQTAGTRLRPATPQATPVAQAQQDAANLAQVDAIPAPLPRVNPAGARIKAAQVVPAALTQAELPAIASLGAVIRTQSASAVTLPVSKAIATVAPLTAVLPVAQPAVAVVETALPPITTLSQSDAPRADVAATKLQPLASPTQQIVASQVQPATPNAQKLKAALAFSSADGDVDPVSVAAFQSFMRPDDIAANGDQLRDGVEGLLAQVPCSRMQVTFDPDTAILQVNGHIPDDDLRAPVLAALQAQMGANISVSDNILILPRPQCGALSGIVGVGLPQSTDQITNPRIIGRNTQVGEFRFSEGELLFMDMTAPDYDAYIYLDYFDKDGNVLHLEPNEYATLRQADAKTVQRIGAETMQDSRLKLVISPPFGQEIVVAFAASEPLYDGLRPIQEPAAQYLEWLQGQVTKARERSPDFKGEWIYIFVTTVAR